MGGVGWGGVGAPSWSGPGQGRDGQVVRSHVASHRASQTNLRWSMGQARPHLGSQSPTHILAPQTSPYHAPRNSLTPHHTTTPPPQALPKDGYTKIFENMYLDNPLIDIRLGVDFFDVKDKLPPHKLLVFTGPIDAYYASMGLPKLEYRSLRFEKEYHEPPGGYYQEALQVSGLAGGVLVGGGRRVWVGGGRAGGGLGGGVVAVLAWFVGGGNGEGARSRAS